MQAKEQTYIYGKHPVSEALARAPQTVRHLYIVSGHGTESFAADAQRLNIPFDRCDAHHLPRGVDRNAVHQGILALVNPAKILVPYKQFMDELTVTDATALVLLDELTDPQNVGAVIRSAAAFGVAGVLIPEYRQAPITGTVVKVSAGMAFTVPLVSVGNVNTVLRDLKDKGFWIYGLVGNGDTSLPAEDFSKPTVLVIGNEGRGLREKTEEVCDFRLSIPIDPKCESLNAAASAAVALYAWRTQRSMS
jgi:23S rRNA (guanosine2251-2'-O)-methyltransferase